MSLSYDPSKIPQPTTEAHAYAYAILVELRAIRIALQAQNEVKLSAQSPVVTTSVVPKQPTKAR